MPDTIQWWELRWGRRLWNGDVIRITLVERGDPAFMEFGIYAPECLEPYRDWVKGIILRDARDEPLYSAGTGIRAPQDFGPNFIRVPLDDEMLQNTKLEFLKAAAFGQITGFYDVRDLRRCDGLRIVFSWLATWNPGTPDPPAMTTPVPWPE